MPLCTNIPEGCKKVYFTGEERTPTGYGLSPSHEAIGTVERGRDGRAYMVGYSGVNTKRWVHMWWESTESR
jgi:hypothetical protein